MTAPGPPFSIRRPSDAAMRAFLATQTGAVSTYARLDERARARLFPVDRSEIVGAGAVTFARAVGVLERWEQYPAPWTTVISDHQPPRVGDVTCARLHHAGFWSLAACRVVALEASDRRWSLTIETLEGHAEIGTETFSLALEEDRVVYRITSRSGPGHWLAKLGVPVMRHYQERFLRESPVVLRELAR